jgi:hypothetical protein
MGRGRASWNGLLADTESVRLLEAHLLKIISEDIYFDSEVRQRRRDETRRGDSGRGED